MERAARTMVAALLAVLMLSVTGQRLLAQAAATRPGDAVQVWTSDVCTDNPAMVADHVLKPIMLVGARNGSFSGKLMVESGRAIKGLKAIVGVISGPGGAIPAENFRVRYGVDPDTPGNNSPGRWDVLLEAPPAEVPLTDNVGRLSSAGRAVIPVWITVKVPKTAQAGTYSGEVTVQIQGVSAVKTPLKLEVTDWTLPDPQDFRTWMDFVESPDTLALEYNVPFWSKKHWDLIDRSFRLLGPTGGRVVYVPLICRTNLGNEHSMVRWIPKGDGQYDYDFTVLDQYLDSAEKNLGRPKIVVFQVWDISMSAEAVKPRYGTGDNSVLAAREALLGKGPRVTALDPKTQEATILTLPRYEDPASKALWQPLYAELRQRMEKRGLEKTTMLGLMCDIWPSKEEVTFWKDVSGGRPWVIHGHAGQVEMVDPDKNGLYGISPIGYSAFVYNIIYNLNPEKGRMYGWQNKAVLSTYWRGGALNQASSMDVREFPVFNITGNQRGGGRMGGDLWPVLRNKAGARSGQVWTRYPENNWRNLNLLDWCLAPGPDGAVATKRLESLIEGIQECEARILLEDALLDAGKKATLGADLAKRCQDALDEHHHAMWKSVWNDDDDLKKFGRIEGGRWPVESLYTNLEKVDKTLPKFWSSPFFTRWKEETYKGQTWFLQGWQEREKKLFVLAGEVAAKLGPK